MVELKNVKVGDIIYFFNNDNQMHKLIVKRVLTSKLSILLTMNSSDEKITFVSEINTTSDNYKNSVWKRAKVSWMMKRPSILGDSETSVTFNHTALFSTNLSLIKKYLSDRINEERKDYEHFVNETNRLTEELKMKKQYADEKIMSIKLLQEKIDKFN